jgi:hypothetical protein
MGSVKRVDSNRTKDGGRSAPRGRHARLRARASNAPSIKPDIDEILGRRSDVSRSSRQRRMLCWVRRNAREVRQALT